MENCLKGSHDELGHLDLVTALGMDCGIPPPPASLAKGEVMFKWSQMLL